MQLDVELAWSDGGMGDLSRITVEGSDGVAVLEGLFGFSTHRRLATQHCRLVARGERPQIVHFAPGPGLQEAAFGAMLARFSKFCCGEDAPIASFSEIQRLAGWLEDIRARGMPGVTW